MTPLRILQQADHGRGKRLRVGGEQAFVDYQRERNARSLDGLPAVEPGVTEPA